MDKKALFVPLYLKDGAAVSGLEERGPLPCTDALALARQYSDCGADGILVFDLSEGDQEHDAAISLIRRITESAGIPVFGGGNIRRLEDVKKLLYAGCRKVFLNFSKEGNRALAKEAGDRFGREKILACATVGEWDALASCRDRLGGVIWLDADLAVQEGTAGEVLALADSSGMECVLCVKDCREAGLVRALRLEQAEGVCCDAWMGTSDFYARKDFLAESGIEVARPVLSLAWEDLKPGADGLVPVVVQDDSTQEVLMLAYMNRQAYEETARTGRMTYWSRSRGELWVKGLTSGHFQYVRELSVDCDNDTLLAKVRQVGAACHTGHKSCFYRPLLEKEERTPSPREVLEEVFQVILDRREHPKEGSYTNYLFDKGIDKVLKKVGEEATEIVIAAKNPDPEEVKYEISDFLYHVMVLMAIKGVRWEDIAQELSRR